MYTIYCNGQASSSASLSAQHKLQKRLLLHFCQSLHLHRRLKLSQTRRLAKCPALG